MSDEPHTPAPPSVDDFMTSYFAHAARAAELHPANKEILLTALRDAGIARVEIRFDGYGDSGQIEQISAQASDTAPRDIPDEMVELQSLPFHQDEPVTVSEPLGQAIETMCYALLETAYAGWENNEGAFGDFTFDVAAGTITLDYNQRIETSEHFGHEF